MRIYVALRVEPYHGTVFLGAACTREQAKAICQASNVVSGDRLTWEDDVYGYGDDDRAVSEDDFGDFRVVPTVIDC